MLFVSILLPILMGAAATGVDWSATERDDEGAEPVEDEIDELQPAHLDVGVEGALFAMPSEGEPHPDAAPGEVIEGTDEDDILIGTELDDLINAGDGADRVSAQAGDDLVYGEGGSDTVLGREGVDVLSGGLDGDLLKGGHGNDFLFGEEGDDTLIGSPGDDLVVGGSGSDYLRGDQGDDLIVALDNAGSEDAPDTLVGGIGNDRLIGDNGDIMTGGPGVTQYEVVVGGDPVVITDFDLFHEPGSALQTDILTLLDGEGDMFTRQEIIDSNGRLESSDNGEDVNVILNDRLAVVIQGYDPEDFQQDSNWLGNFSPESTGRLDGNDSLMGDENDIPTDDFLSSGLGDDTLVGGLGADYLDGGQGNDLLDSTDAIHDPDGYDTVVGGDGDDHFIADDGDIIGGQLGRDSYDIYVPQADGDAPVEIYGYELSTADGEVEFLTLLGPDGVALSSEEVAENLVIYQDTDGTDAILEYDGRVAVVLRGMDATALADQEIWIGNFDPDPAAPPPSGPTVHALTEISMTLQSSSASGNFVTSQMFGANAVYSVNTEDGVPLENYSQAAQELEISHFRFPAGQGDSLTGESEGVDWLNVIELVEDDSGEMVLRDEVKNALDAAIAAHQNDLDAKVTMVIPSKLYTVDEYEARYDDIARFAEIMVTDYAEVIEAIEIGNEYWAIGETDYGQKADIAARALSEGMARAEVDEDDQPSILVQMATPNEGSEFHTSVDDRPFGERRDDANQQIIDQLSVEARDAIDGVVEHYYYRRDYDEFTDDGSEVGFIPNDYAIWEQNFDKELDLHITEWNIRTTNLEQNGIRSAGVLAEQFENMIEMGADAAHGWPAVHNTNSHWAGTRSDMPIVNDDGWVVNSVRGATFDVMSSELVGTELLETEFSNDDGRMEVQAYQSEGKVVVQVVSRTGEPVDLNLDIRSLVGEYESATGVVVGYDKSADSSDGIYRDKAGNFVQADSTFVNGQNYYFNEHDTRGTVTNIDVDSADMQLHLDPFEMIQMTFVLGPDGPPSESGTTFTGTEADDTILTAGGNDFVFGLGGNDNIDTTDGLDRIEAGAGDDRVEGGRGDDSIFGDAGADTLYGHGGDDSIKGGDGDDILSGNQGDDTLLGSSGADALRGGDGEDTLNGGIGSDTLSGGNDRDTLTGWSGSDTFTFTGEEMANGDIITDFETGSDIIQLDYGDIQSMDDLTIDAIDQGILITVGDHGALLLQGELTMAQIADPRNFLFM